MRSCFYELLVLDYLTHLHGRCSPSNIHNDVYSALCDAATLMSIPSPSAPHYWDSAFPDNMPLKYYLSGNSENFIHPVTRRKLEKLLYMLAEQGEAYTMCKNQAAIPADTILQKSILSSP